MYKIINKINFFLLLAFPILTFAHIFECELNGKKIYTDKIIKGCKASKLKDIGYYSSHNDSVPKTSASKNKKISNNITKNNSLNRVSYSSGNNQVNTNIQKNRDAGRRKILTQELENERLALMKAKQKLSVLQQQKTQFEEIRKIQNDIIDRQHNIESILKEISRI